MRFLNISRRASEEGLTLVEMMVAISIAALLAVTGVPFFGDYIVNSRLRESGNLLLTDVLFAQSEAIKRNGQVAIELDGDTLTVTDANTGKELRSRAMPTGIAMTSTEPKLVFGSTGRTVPFGQQYVVDFSMSGVTCSDEKRCPSLRIDAGGAARLCGNRLSSCL